MTAKASEPGDIAMRRTGPEAHPGPATAANLPTRTANLPTGAANTVTRAANTRTGAANTVVVFSGEGFAGELVSAPCDAAARRVSPRSAGEGAA
ncbi:hypothetical protein SAMN05421810_10470 [Amycolatopsis arida]|uniref:Uncharacterized protein n=1 Tax=Amycolatopsis arida TaxID=587909 RepID=A0A1I5UQ54_9PSEU|nr:hypothetical protein CLV69_10669 [Amycolatopsis arida]SFP97328.1 hypothetical protein SAMN05421810_10470 [Amycolatopsis arida]